jgi:hypothetical protein
LKRFWQAVSLLAIMFYLLIGGVLIFSNWFERVIANSYSGILGGVLMLYGAYRIVRWYIDLKADQDEENAGT